VEVFERRYQNGKRGLGRVAAVQTNDRGEYRHFNLKPGVYYLRASKPGQDPLLLGGFDSRGARVRMFEALYFPGVREEDRATPLEVKPGGEVEHVDLRIGRVGVYSIRGTAPAGAPIAVAFGSGGGGSYALRRTGRSGEGFEIQGLPPGTYVVRASRGDFEAVHRVEIVDQDVDGIDLMRSTAREISGVVKVEGGGAAPSALLLRSDDPALASTMAANLKPDGTFSMTIQAVPYTVSIGPGREEYVKSVRVRDHELADHGVSDAGPITVVLAKDTGRVTGSVADVTGSLVERAMVTLLPDQNLPYWQDLAQSALSDASGNFHFARVPPGDYRLFAWGDVESGAPFAAEFRKPYEAQGTAVRVDARGTVSVKLVIIK
jgi:hypothetical protein